VDVGAADAAVRDKDVDVDGGKGLGGEGRPGHGARGGGFVVAEPAGEVGRGGHGCWMGLGWWVEMGVCDDHVIVKFWLTVLFGVLMRL
jgi:hypothetical protein